MHAPTADSTPRDAKPAACRVCGGRAGVEHIVETARPAASVVPLLPWALVPMLPQPRRYAQVVCRICDARGPRVLFVTSDEWPHIAAEKTALAKWAWMQRER